MIFVKSFKTAFLEMEKHSNLFLYILTLYFFRRSYDWKFIKNSTIFLALWNFTTVQIVDKLSIFFLQISAATAIASASDK